MPLEKNFFVMSPPQIQFPSYGSDTLLQGKPKLQFNNSNPTPDISTQITIALGTYTYICM